MPTSIAALTPADQTFRHRTDESDSAVQEISFNQLWQDKKEGISFGDFLDIINPLQHIPVVSTIYRMVTGDEIGVGSRLAGGALFGGPLGLLGAGAIALFEDVSGETVEKQVASLWNDITGDRDAAPQMASAEKTSAPAAAQLAAMTPNAGAPAAEAPARAAAQIATPTPAPTLAAAAPATPAPSPVPYFPAVPVPQPAANTPAVLSAKAPAEDSAPTSRTASDADAAAERRRIAQSIEQAQRAQATLLLASLGAERPTSTADESDDGKTPLAGTAAPEPQPFRPHPYLLPPGASPEMVNRAMERALDRYQATLQQRNAAAARQRTAPAALH